MGSSNDGSSSAQGAQIAASTEEPPQEIAPRGLIGRLLSAFSPQTEEAEAEAASQRADNRTGLGALRKLQVDDVAIPKADIIAVPMDIGLSDLVEVYRTHGFSRLPVYKGTLDHPQGLVLLKDIAMRFGFGSTEPFDLQQLIRPILFAPPSMSSGTLLQKMQKERVHMALVIDEYGGVDGLVTIEDLIETVLGEIDDEHDEALIAQWTVEAPGVIVADSTAPLDELEGAIACKLRDDSGEDDDIDTIGGLVFLRTGQVPSVGEVVALNNGAEVEILEADMRRIKRLRLRLPQVPSSQDMN